MVCNFLFDQTIFVRIFGNGDTIICQAYGSVKVGVPSSVVLNVQSQQLGVGREMPIYPLFSEVKVSNERSYISLFISSEH